MTKAPVSPEGRDEGLAGSDRLRRIGDDLRNGVSAPTVTVRQFLEWFGATRRGQWIVSGIRQALDKAGIITRPDFEDAFIDASITFELPTAQQNAEATYKPAENPRPMRVAESSAAPYIASPADPTYRISRLAAANATPVSVTPDSTVVAAVTLMMKHDFSQLPVMTSPRTVKGIVSWRSIGSRWVVDRPGVFVRDYMEEPQAVPADRSLFAALPVIVEHGYVLIRDTDSRIVGIVTTSDLSLQFQQLSEPFLLLGEIENHLRSLIDNRLTVAELAAAKDPADVSRTINRAADLTFGEYVRLLQNEDRWSKLGLGIDRGIFTKDLERIRSIRNDVMHFDPDPLAEKDLDALRQFVRFLQSLHALRSHPHLTVLRNTS